MPTPNYLQTLQFMKKTRAVFYLSNVSSFSSPLALNVFVMFQYLTQRSALIRSILPPSTPGHVDQILGSFQHIPPWTKSSRETLV